MNEERHSFIENGQKHMQCKSRDDYRPVADKIVSFTCGKCTMIRTLKRMPLEEMVPSLKKKKTATLFSTISLCSLLRPFTPTRPPELDIKKVSKIYVLLIQYF